MAHPSARLSVFSRQLLVKRVVVDGWPVATVAEQLGISRATGYKWVRRYRAEGLPGLEDRSSRPHRSPRRSSDEVTAAIIRAALRRRYGPARLAPLTGHPRSTIYGVLRRRRPQPPARHRPGDRRPGPLRGLPPGRARPPGPQEARPGPRRRWLARPRPGAAPFGTAGSAATTTSRCSSTTPAATPSSCRSPTSAAESASWAVEVAVTRFAEVGIRIERILTDNGAELPQPRLPRRARPARHPPQADPAVPAADQRQGRALHPDPARRVGLRPAVPHRTASAYTPSAGSSTSTITDVRTPRSAASCPASLSTTSPSITSRDWPQARQP